MTLKTKNDPSRFDFIILQTRSFWSVKYTHTNKKSIKN